MGRRPYNDHYGTLAVGPDRCQGAVVSRGALGHYGMSLRDPISATGLPVVKVRLSNVHKRKPFRRRGAGGGGRRDRPGPTCYVGTIHRSRACVGSMPAPLDGTSFAKPLLMQEVAFTQLR